VLTGSTRRCDLDACTGAPPTDALASIAELPALVLR
jgi:hypothetical protein